MFVFWTIALIVFVVIEIATAGICSIWFAAGALAALPFAALELPFWLQLTVFVIVSAVALALARPLLVKRFQPGKTATTFDRALNMVGIVTADVDNIAGTGTVRVDGKDWTARSLDGTPIPAGTPVTADRIEGVKLIVRAVSEQEQ